MTQETLSFQAEVSRLLHIVTHSLYSEREIFLRELISNASDACDRLRYAALTEPHLAEGDSDYRIRLVVDKDAGTLTVADNGIGMNRDELIENLGTIARSGTRAFLDRMSQQAADKAAPSLIGQFGVGFYSAFMAASRVEVFARKAGDDQGWRWESDGSGQFTVADAEGVDRGTRVVLYLAEEAKEFLEAERLRHIVKKYSDHIGIPIVLVGGDDGDETLNRASALWTRPKSEISADDYKEFYHHVSHAFDDPWLTTHWKAEGTIEYTGLLYVPSTRPYDLFMPERRHHVKLYVKRVFITDDCEGLVPSWLRFLRGVVDSEDLPLNISRETLQHNPILAKIRSGLVKRMLSELESKAKNDAEAYAQFWNNFGAVLKEGIYEDHGHRDTLLGLARFQTTRGEDLVSLQDYVDAMRPGQEAIFYITGDDLAQLRRSPQLEGFRAKGVEVLLLTDPIDEFWVTSVGEFDGKPLKSVTRGGVDLGKVEAPERDEPETVDQPAEGKLDTLIAVLKSTLGETVKDVRRSDRLTDSAVCLVADEGDMDMHLARLLKAHNQLDQMAPRVLEINPGHPLVKRLTDLAGQDATKATLEDAAWLLLDQARILEGESLSDPVAFARRLSDVMANGL